MKRLTSFLIVGALIATCCTAFAATRLTSNGFEYGDVNSDGNINIKDTLVLQKYLAGVSVSIDLEAADVYYDGEINAKDSIYLKRYLCNYSLVIGPGEGVTTKTVTTTATSISEATTAQATTQATAQATTVADDDKNIDEIIANIENASFSDTKVDLKTTYDEATFVTLSDSEVKVDGTGVQTDGNVIKITEEGSYVFSGTMSDGQIYTEVSGNVYIILNGVDLTCKTSAPIAIFGSKKKVVTVADGTKNTLTDAASYTSFYNTDNDEPNACIFAKNALTINGSGELTVNANYNNGVGSKDSLKIMNASLTVKTTVGNAVKGNDSVIIKNADLTVNSAADGIKSDSETDGDGYIICYNTTANIASIEDGFQAYSYLYFVGGSYTVKTGSSGAQSSYSSSDTTGRKGIKCDNNLLVTDGDTPLEMSFDTADDAIHCNNSIVIKSGDITISSADDGIHADKILQIDGGNINITKCYEGYEAAKIIVNGGTNTIKASDDGMNATDGSSTTGGFGGGWGGSSSSSTDVYLQINGGYTYIITNGDGIDSNGSTTFNGGTAIVIGPTNGGNSCLDSESGIIYNGGTVLGVSSSSAMWSQDVIGKITGNYIYNTNSGSVSLNGMVSVKDSAGNVLVAVKMPISGNIGIVFMTDTTTVSTCSFNLNGTFTGSLDANGVAFDGTVSGGTTVSPGSSSGSRTTTTRRRW